MIQIVLADDRALFREGIRRILADESDLHVEAELSTGVDLLDTIAGIAADTVLLGVVDDDWTRIVALIPTLIEAGHRVLVMATNPEQRYIDRALHAGAAGMVTTEATAAELIEAIQRVASGRRLPGGLTGRSGSGRRDRPLSILSAREYEVMRLLGGGHSVREIAERLDLSPKTVGTYRGRVKEKLGLSSTVELVRFVLERGLAG